MTTHRTKKVVVMYYPVSIYYTVRQPFIHCPLQNNLTFAVAVEEEVAEAPLETAPVPVSFLFLVSLLFCPVGCSKYIGIFKLEVPELICLPATIGPTRRARKTISIVK